MPNFSRFFQCFKKKDHERETFDRLVGKVDEKVMGFFESKTDEYTKKADKLIDDWLSGSERRECKSLLADFRDEIDDCFGEVRSTVHEAIDYHPPNAFERFCGRVEQLFDDLFGD